MRTHRIPRKWIVVLFSMAVALSLSHSGRSKDVLIPLCEDGSCVDRWVSNAADEGNGTLRAVLWDACHDPKDDAIQFLIREDIPLESPIAIPADCDGKIFLHGKADIRTVIDGSLAGVPPAGENHGNCLIKVESGGNFFEHITVVGFKNESLPGGADPGIGICFIGDGNALLRSSIGFRPNSDGSEGNDIGVFLAGSSNSLSRNIITFNTGDGVLVEGNSNVLQGNYIGNGKERCDAQAEEKREEGLREEGEEIEAPEGKGLEPGDEAEDSLAEPASPSLTEKAMAGGCSLTLGTAKETGAGNDMEMMEEIPFPGIVGGVLLPSDPEIPRRGLDPGLISPEFTIPNLSPSDDELEPGCPLLSNGGHGIHIRLDGHGNTVGGRGELEKNILQFNGGDGVRLDGSNESVGNRISANSFYKNAGLGIDLGPEGVSPNDEGDADVGPNTMLNAPEELQVLMREWRENGRNRYRFTLVGRAPEGAEVEVYLTDGSTIQQDLSLQGDASGHGEGELMILTFVNAENPFTVDLPSIARGTKITALAIDAGGNTSEFSENAILDKDSDHDRIADLIEDRNRNELVDGAESDPFDADTDGDGLTDNLEDRNKNGRREKGELPATIGDADEDGLSDFVETRGDGTFDRGGGDSDPLKADSDCDGLLDGEEDGNGNGIAEFHLGESDPKRADSDGDGISDGPLPGDCQGVPGARDNCPTSPNPGQSDRDGDGVGDMCDGT